MKKVLFVVLFSVLLVQIRAQKAFQINFDSNLGNLKSFNNVNGGPGKSVNGYLDAGVSMIRTHDITACDYMNYSQFWKNGNLNYSFNPTDSTLYGWNAANIKIDSITRFNFTPFFRLGISYTYTKDTIFTRPPFDSNRTTFSKFAELSKRTVMHFNSGWASGFNKNIPYWEIWNEPDGGFWRSDSLTFYKFFKEVSDSLHLRFPQLKFGGPGVLSGTVVSKRGWLPAFLNYCKNNNVHLDFFSWHMYSQLNPYALAVWGDYVRNQLDAAGFTSTESIITEMNIDLGQTGNPNLNSPKGAAYMASAMISAQMGKVDKIVVYRGEGIMNMLNNDSLGFANYTYNGLGFKAYSLLYNHTPVMLNATGSVFIPGEQYAKRDTTNLMILAAKSTSARSCYILISNYKSTESNYAITINNLPWKSSGQVTVTQNIVNDNGSMFAQTAYTMNGNSTLNLQCSNMQAPTVLLLRLDYTGELLANDEDALQETSFALEQNYPNPFNPETRINYRIEKRGMVQLSVYDLLGNHVTTLVDKEHEAGSYSIPFNAGAYGLSSGLYIYRLQANGVSNVKKMCYLK